jgi:hypothetical protein
MALTATAIISRSAEAAHPHQLVGHQHEGLELGAVEGVGAEHVGHEAELLLALGEVLGDFRVQAILRSRIERHQLGLAGHWVL